MISLYEFQFLSKRFGIPPMLRNDRVLLLPYLGKFFVVRKYSTLKYFYEKNN
jgi:hypothetical protein